MTETTAVAPVAISAVVCTRDRGADVIRTIRSLLQSTHDAFELIVIDQSADDATARAVAPLLEDQRLRYVRTATRGLSRARNLGLALARADVVAFTDDDCEAPPEWLTVFARVFDRYPRVAAAYCDVAAGPHDPLSGYVPVFRARRSGLITTISAQQAVEGFGAGMAVRRTAVQALGGFDELLGAGARFRASEDMDLAMRVLLNGDHIFLTNETAVLHHGFRTWRELNELFRGYWMGIGAALVKPLKCGDARGAALLVRFVGVHLVGRLLRDALQSGRPRYLVRIPALLHGAVGGWRTAVDRQRLLYRAS